MLVCAVVVFLTLPAGMYAPRIWHQVLTNIQTAALDITITSIRALVPFLVCHFWFNEYSYYPA